MHGLKINKINGFRNGLASALSEEENKHNEVMNQFALSFVCLTLQTEGTERAKSFKELLQVKKGICNQLLQIHSGISLPQNLNKEGIPSFVGRTRMYRAFTHDQKNTLIIWKRWLMVLNLKRGQSRNSEGKTRENNRQSSNFNLLLKDLLLNLKKDSLFCKGCVPNQL